MQLVHKYFYGIMFVTCYDYIKDFKPKRLPLTDVQMHEMFKKRYGTKQAIKFKVGVYPIPYCRTDLQ